jgi:hypothetical protein
MKKKTLQLVLLGACTVLLGYSLFFEKHEVRSLSTDQPQSLTAMQFVAGTTTDDFLRREQRLYDTRSLLPSWASVKDCKA